MAKICSGCGKTLSFMDSFVFERKPVCKACLQEKQGKTATPKKSPEGIGGWLLVIIIGIFLTALLNLSMAFLGGNAQTIGILPWVTNTPVAFFLGILGFATGFVLVFSRDSRAVWVPRAYLGFFLLTSLVVAITGLDAPSGYYVRDEQAVIIRGIFQAVFMNAVWQTYFLRSVRVRNTYRSFPGPAVAAAAPARSLTAYFHRDSGVHLGAGFGFFLGFIVITIVESPLATLFSGGNPFYAPALHYLISSVVLVLRTALLVWLLSRLREDLVLACAWGGAAIIFYGMNTLAWRFSGVEGMRDIPLSFLDAMHNMVYAFLWILGMSLAVKKWGFRWRSVVLGGVAAELFTWGLFTVIDRIRIPDLDIAYWRPISSLILGLIFHSLFYAGAALWKRKSVASA